MGEKKIIRDATTCSECITITLDLPKNCRLNEDMIETMAKELFKQASFKDVCRGCPLENRERKD